MNKNYLEQLLNHIKWNKDNLIPVITQEINSYQILMLAWMNKEAIQTCETGLVHYFGRSRKKLWLKGESSGHFQNLKNLYLDCDQDVLLAQVEQIGGIACHTGKASCFFITGMDNNGNCAIQSLNILILTMEINRMNELHIPTEITNTIENRKNSSETQFYVAYLLSSGQDNILKKS